MPEGTPTRLIRAALMSFMRAHNPQFFITHTYGYLAPPEARERALKNFYNRVERLINGRNWHRLPPTRRVVGIGMYERLDLNPHCHVLVGGTEDLMWLDVESLPDIWTQLQPRGQLHVEAEINSKNVSRYSTKGVWNPDNMDDLFVYAPDRRIAGIAKRWPISAP